MQCISLVKLEVNMFVQVGFLVRICKMRVKCVCLLLAQKIRNLFPTVNKHKEGRGMSAR